MGSLELKIKHLSDHTKLDNAEIASRLKCSERSVRRYAGEWKKRVVERFSPKDFSGGERKAILFYDIHQPYHNRAVYDIAMGYAKAWEPDEIYIGGDFVDFKDISTWKDDPLRMPFKDEVAFVKNNLHSMRETFPDAKIIYIEGNHENRLSRYMWSKAPEFCGLPELAFEKLMDLESIGIQYYSNVDRLNMNFPPVRIGKLYVLHGHEIMLGSGTVNLARTMYLKTHVNVIFGHHHQSQNYIFKKLDGTYEGSWAVGCLCNLSEQYQPMNNWINGFCTIKYNPQTGYFKVRNKLIIDGQIL
jgi:predicted phosphodiesterase